MPSSIIILNLLVSSLLSTPGRSASKWLATEGWASSLLWYSWSEAHCIISRCIRYCIVSIRTQVWPSSFLAIIRSIKVSPRPFRSASVEMMVGGSWKWSPANSALGARVSANQQAASVDYERIKSFKIQILSRPSSVRTCEHSSITT